MPERRDLQINHIAVHKVKKDQFEDRSTLTLSESVLEVDDYASLFLNEFVSIYQNPRKTSKSFARFDTEKQTSQSYEDLLKAFITDSVDFLETSKNITRLFNGILSGISAATGGYVFCVDYLNTGDRNFAVLILDQQIHPAIVEKEGKFSLTSSFTLETESISMAANVKIVEWQSDSEASYLSYVRGKKGITDYFKRFIGCTTAQSSTVATNNVIEAVYGFVNETYEDDARERRIEEAKDAMFSVMKQNIEHITLDTVWNWVFPEENERNRFIDYTIEKDLQISDEFSPDGRTLNKLKRFEYSSKGIELKIRNDVFNDRNRVEFQEGTDYLIIRDPEIRAKYKMQN